MANPGYAGNVIRDCVVPTFVSPCSPGSRSYGRRRWSFSKCLVARGGGMRGLLLYMLRFYSTSLVRLDRNDRCIDAAQRSAGSDSCWLLSLHLFPVMSATEGNCREIELFKGVYVNRPASCVSVSGSRSRR